ncbi:hypothetical protein BD626DRAFT_515595 [Schizophyllum amplum]|uniref:Carrier domain-containing protein n=1 Tax=Schizophyllum amplum TaxID=97359 RepID=A0A550BXJ5_9AGAR|nr:hypothetical protein BD626DRAFT_515595 [Auriculariopsis ampla]
MAIALAFPSDLLHANGVTKSVHEFRIPGAILQHSQTRDVLLLAALSAVHVLATGIEDAAVAFVDNEGRMQYISLHVDEDMTAGEAIAAVQHAFTKARTVDTQDRLSDMKHGFPLAVSSDGVHCTFAGDATLYSPANIYNIASNVLDALKIVAESPATLISDFSFPSALSRLHKAGISLAPPPPPSHGVRTFRDAFARAASAYPTNVALTDGETDYNYAEFDALTDMLADEIAEILSGGADTGFIATCIPSSPIAIIVLYAIIKYGNAYVPLDVRLPTSRLKHSPKTLAPRFSSHAPTRQIYPQNKHRMMDWTGSSRTLWARHAERAGVRSVHEWHTGLPKGVRMTVSAVLSLIYDRAVGLITPDMRVAQVLNLAWTDVLDPKNLAKLIRLRQVNVTTFATSLFRQVLSVAPDLLRTYAWSSSVERHWISRSAAVSEPFNSTAELINGYGPTETCLMATAYSVHRLLEQGPYTQCVVLDKQMRLAPPGIPGELYIGGRAETAAAFVRISIPGLDQPPSISIERCGDLVRWLPSGDMQFERRLQAGQIKIRGQRLELAEVEAVIVSTCDGRSPYLAAFVVPSRDNNAVLDPHAFVRALKAAVPAYMVPHALDRRALEGMALQRDTEPDRICAIYSQIIGVKQVRAEDDFFDVGGHSLLAMQVKWRLDKEFGYFQGATPRHLASLLEKSTCTSVKSIAEVVRMLPNANGSEYPLSAGPVAVLCDHCPFWLRLRGPLDEDLLERAVQDMARRQDILRTVFIEADDDLRARRCAGMKGTPLAARLPSCEQTPPFRPTLFRLGPQEYVLCSLDHIITDGFSEDVIIKELANTTALSVAVRPVLPALPVSCADFARWEQSESFAALIAPQLDYWAAQLQGSSAAAFVDAELPDANHSARSTAGACVPIALSESLVARIDAACTAMRVTFTMALMAALRVVHFRRTGIADAVSRSEIAPLQGFFATALMYRIHVAPGQTFREVLEQTRTLSVEGFAHTDAHMATIMEALWARALAPGNVPMRIAMGYVIHDASSCEAAGVQMERMEVNMHAVQLDMEIYFGRTAGSEKVTGEINYRKDLFSESYVQGLAAETKTVLEKFAETSEFLVD